MKIHLDGVSLNARTGPSTFARRFARELLNRGHELELDGEAADASLVFIEPTGVPLASKVVQRLDGIWFKPNEFATKNVAIRRCYERADHVIWQSNFDREMSTKWFGTPKNGTVITNGIDIEPVKEFTSVQLQSLSQTYEKLFVCSANWHPQKRLRANVELFEHVRNNGQHKSCMLVLGANPDYIVSSPHIFYTGNVPQEVYMQIYSMCDWMIHLAWADHCPNTVVEALSQGTPVICSTVGGTKELVGEFGIVLDEEPYDFSLFDYDSPPKIDVTQLKNLPDKSTLGKHADISIASVVDSYIKVLESL